MLYITAALSLTLFFVLHTVHGRKRVQKSKEYIKSELIIAAIGVAICLIIRPISYLVVSKGGYSENYKSWVLENLSIYLSDSFILFSVLMGGLLISESLTFLTKETKSFYIPIIRTLLALASSVIFFLFCTIYAYASQDGAFPICEIILIIGIAQALMFRAPIALELIIREKAEKKMPQKQNPPHRKR